jgi:hypothetical protein
MDDLLKEKLDNDIDVYFCPNCSRPVEEYDEDSGCCFSCVQKERGEDDEV